MLCGCVAALDVAGVIRYREEQLVALLIRLVTYVWPDKRYLSNAEISLPNDAIS
jgi:hypothetical protein